MKTKNLCFSGIKSLEQFLTDQQYASESNLLIQIFTSDLVNNYLSRILNVLITRLPHSVIIGSTTDGEIYDGKSVSGQTIISFSIFDKVKPRAKFFSLNESHFKIGGEIVKSLCTESTKAMILFADGLNINGDDLLDGIYDANKNVVIAGGLAGDYRNMQRTFIICGNEVKSDGVVACVLDSDELIVNVAYVFGWKTIGKQMIVTKANRNRLYELDNEPLNGVYAKYLGNDVAIELPVSAGEFPLIINRFGKHVARAALKIFDDGSMLYPGNFNIGDKVQFGYGHIPMILNNSNQIIDSISDLPIESVFIYSCSARKYFMLDEVNSELEPLNLLGSTSGFFTYGEFFHDDKKNELLNETMTLLLLSEASQTAKKQIKHHSQINDKTAEKRTLNTLFNLIEATGNELSNTNEKLEFLVTEKTKQLTERIYYDTLTKLPSRNLLLDNFSYRSEFIPIMLAIINIDDFKRINDFYGNKAGDRVLVKIAEQINSVLKETNNLVNCRLYKLPVDEFAIAANNRMNTKEFTNLIDQVLSVLLNSKVAIESDNFFLDYTAGVALGRAESNDYLDEADGILTQAYMALRQAKDSNAPKIIYKYDMILRKQLEYNLIWAKKIKQAITNDKFIPYFQAIYLSENDTIDKYECLIRMVDSDNSLVSPVAFLDIAKKSKLYPNLTQIMISKCFAIFAENKKNFSINISIADIQNPETVTFMVDYIGKYNIGKQLTIEILESEDIKDYNELRQFTRKMQLLGCKIAIDDFGSGYSNFRHIIQMDIDFIKIDGSLIKNINEELPNRLMVEMIIDFCKKAKILTVAEFVATKAIYDTVKSLGVDYLQGYYLSEPTATC